jgi:hypothetical protein
MSAPPARTSGFLVILAVPGAAEGVGDALVGGVHPVRADLPVARSAQLPTSASIIFCANPLIISRRRSGLADARVSSNGAPGTGTMSPTATSLSFVSD